MTAEQSVSVAGGILDLQSVGKLLGRFKAELVAITAFSAVVNILMLSPTLYMLQVFDRVMVSQSELTLLVLTLLVLGFYVVQALCEWMRSRLMVAAGLRLDAELSVPVFGAMFSNQLGGNAGPPGRAFADMTILRQWLTGQGALAYFDLPWSPIYLAVMFMLHPFLGVMALVFMAVLAAFAWWTTAATAATGEAVEEREQELDAFVHGKLRNAEVIEAHGMVPGLLSRWSAYQSKCVALHVSAHSLEERFTVTSKELRMLMQSLAIGGAALLAIRGEISFGAMIAASLLIGRATSPIDQLVAGWRQFISAKQALRRLRALLQTPMTRGRAVLDAADPVAVQLCSVSASAPGRKDPILHELSATFPGGKIYAVMGDSGAGKSTLGKVILGIWPEVKGSVLYQGRDAKELDRVAIGPHLGYLPQDIELFPATVAENIARMGKPDPDKVIEAARMTGTHEMILRLPMGYDTPIGEAGSALSGGQRQRVALARAIYGTPRLIVLDEPNANLDDAGEKALAEVLEQLKDRGSTVFLITHRHNVVRLADQLLFMRAGRIEKFGPVSPILQDLAAKRQLSGAASGVKSTPINTPELGETSVDG